MQFLPPANEVCEGYVFTRVCHSVHRGACMAGGVWQEGHAWRGGVCVAGEACMAGGAMCGRVCVGCAWWGWGACVVVGGVWVWACVTGGHAWWGPKQILRDTVMRSMSGRYASYWNAFLLRNCDQIIAWRSHLGNSGSTTDLYDYF